METSTIQSRADGKAWPWNSPAKVRGDWKRFLPTLEKETGRVAEQILRREMTKDDGGNPDSQRLKKIIPLISATRSYAMISGIKDFLETNGAKSGQRKWQELAMRASARMEVIFSKGSDNPLDKLKNACLGDEVNSRILSDSHGVAGAKIEELWTEVANGVKNYVDLEAAGALSHFDQLAKLWGGRAVGKSEKGVLARPSKETVSPFPTSRQTDLGK
jgi:hypothetical protein